VDVRYKDAGGNDGAMKLMENMPAAGFSIGGDKIMSHTANYEGTFRPEEIIKAAALIAYGRAAASTKPNVLNDMALVLYDEFHFQHSCITSQHINMCLRWNVGPEDARAKLSSWGGRSRAWHRVSCASWTRQGWATWPKASTASSVRSRTAWWGKTTRSCRRPRATWTASCTSSSYKQLGNWLQAFARARTRGKTPTGSAAVLSPAIEREARNMGMVLTTVRTAQWIAGKRFLSAPPAAEKAVAAEKGAAAAVAATKSAASPAAGRSAAAAGGGGAQAAAGRGGGGTTSFKDARAVARAVAQADHPATRCPFMDTHIKSCINPKCNSKH